MVQVLHDLLAKRTPLPRSVGWAKFIADIKAGEDIHIFDLAEMRRSVARIQSAFKETTLHFAVKANPNEYVLREMQKLGVSFEIAGIGELKRLRKLGIPGDKIIFSNPAKGEEAIKQAYAYGVRWFVTDSGDDIRQLREHAPGSKVILRISTQIENNICDGRFGLSFMDARGLIGTFGSLQVAGFTFHVGTHNTDPTLYDQALASCARVYELYKERGVMDRLEVMDLGGGLPALVDDSILPYTTYAENINAALQRHGLVPERKIMEPGRSMVATAGLTIGSILNVKAYTDPSFDYDQGRIALQEACRARQGETDYHFGQFVTSPEAHAIAFGPYWDLRVMTVSTGRYSAGLDLGFKPMVMRIEQDRLTLPGASEESLRALAYGRVTANLDVVVGIDNPMKIPYDTFVHPGDYLFACASTGAYKQAFQSEWCNFLHPTTYLVDGTKFEAVVSGRGI